MGQQQEKTVAEVLEAAALLIEPEGAWTQGVIAADADGGETGPVSPDARCWCMEGAIERVTAGYNNRAAFEAVRDYLGLHFIHEWNDEPQRTQSEAVDILRKAAAVARERGL